MKIFLIAMLLAVLASPVAAKPDAGVTPITSGPVTLASDQAYILLRLSTAKSGLFKINPVLVRVPTYGELMAYRAAKEQAYRAALPKMVEQAKHGPMPTIDEFSFDYRGAANAFAVDSGKFLVDGELRTVLLQAPPGRYVLYGATIGGGGLVTCNCLGTVSFNAPAGVVTDAGTLYSDKVHKASPLAALESNVGPTMGQYGFVFGQAVVPADARSSVPAVISNSKRNMATFEVVQPFHEYGVSSINRLAPISGILDYRHGRPIDVRVDAASSKP